MNQEQKRRIMDTIHRTEGLLAKAVQNEDRKEQERLRAELAAAISIAEDC